VSRRGAPALLLLAAAGAALAVAGLFLAPDAAAGRQVAATPSGRPGSGAPAPPTAPVPPGSPAVAYFDPGFLRKSAEYTRAQVTFLLNARALRWAVYLTLLMTPLLARLAARLERRLPGRRNAHVAAVSAAVLLVTFAALLPISFASGFVTEHRYGLSNETTAGWLADALKALAIWGAVTCLLTVLYFALRRRMPRGGWAPFAAATVAAVVIGVFVVPVVVDPLFYRFRPLADPTLRRDLVAMAAREGILIDRVLVMEASAKTVRENAYFTGLGRTKRVVLYDNLLEHASPAEVRQVFAHELGHWSRGHITRGLVLAAVTIPLAAWLLWTLHGRLARWPRFGLDGPADPAGIPLVWLLLSVGLFVAAPIEHVVSRSFEREADRVSLELTGDPETFIQGERRMAVNNLTSVDPPRLLKWLFWTHPTTLERIHAAEAWRKGGAG
jgi:STE24 endopeptidase